MRDERRGAETHVYAYRCVSPRVARCRRGGSHSQPCEPLGVSASPPRRIEAFGGRDSGAGGAMAARPSPRASAPAACGRRTHGFVGPRHRPRSAGSARGWPQRSRLPGDARALLTRTRELGWLGADSSGAWGARPWASRGAPPTRRAACVGTTHRPRVMQCQRRGSEHIPAALLRAVARALWRSSRQRRGLDERPPIVPPMAGRCS